MVRGLDYYTRTTFELTSTGPRRAGHRRRGRALRPARRGVRRRRRRRGSASRSGSSGCCCCCPADAADEAPRPVFLAALGAAARRAIWPWLAELRRRGVAAEWDYEGRSLKSQLRRADRLRARHVVIVGENELAAGKVQLRDMAEKTQREVAIAELIETLAPTAYAEGG